MESFTPMLPEHENVIHSCVQLARTLEYEAEHTQQVTRLALLLFDQMKSLHQLDEKERFWLQCAGILHDIGWVEGWKGHHKTSLRIIQTTQLLPLDNKERLIIGSIARYHRKALPDKTHDHFAVLEPAEQEKVKTLSALLRVADGLDASHQSRVNDLSVHITKKRILIRCAIKTLTAIEEEISATNKSDLMVKVFHRTVYFRWKSIL